MSYLLIGNNYPNELCYDYGLAFPSEASVVVGIPWLFFIERTPNRFLRLTTVNSHFSQKVKINRILIHETANWIP